MNKKHTQIEYPTLEQMEEIISDLLDGELRHRKRGNAKVHMRFISVLL